MSVRRTLAVVAVALIAQATVATDLSLLQTFTATLGCPGMNWATEADVCSWDGVSCDSNNAVTEFDMSYESCTGSITTWALPATLQTLYMYSNSLTGTVPSFSGLPATLQDFELQNNDYLSGSIDLTMLPAAMTTISVSGNAFTGTIDMTMLPPTIYTVDASSNKLSGTVDLRKLPSTTVYVRLDDNEFTGLLITNVSSSLYIIDMSSNSLNGMNMDLSMLPNSTTGQSDILELYYNPGICGTYNPAICYAIDWPSQCTCTNNVMTCNCGSPAPWTPYPWTPYPPGTPYPYTPYPWTPLPPFTWSPGSWTWTPDSWSPSSWSPSSWSPSTPTTPVPTSPPNSPTAVWLTVSRVYSYDTYNTTDVYMQWLLAGYFGVNPTAITVMHAPSSGIYTTYSIQFSDTTMIVGGASVTAAAMATTVIGYYTNQLYYTLRSSNFYVSDVAYNYYPVQKKTAPMVVSLTLYRYTSGTNQANLNTLVQTTLAAYFTVPTTSITVTTKNSTSNSVYTYTTLSVTFTDTTTTSIAAIPNQPVSGATMAYALTDYNQNGLYSAFSASSLYVTSATADQTSDGEKSKVPIIVGVIVGVVVLIAIIAFIANRQSGSTGRSDQDYVAMGGKPMV